MTNVRTRAILTITALAATAACSGGFGTPNGPVVNSPGGPTPQPLPLVKVDVHVTIPGTGHAKGVRPDYVSPNTESLVIQLASVDGQGVSGVNATTIETRVHSHGCAPQGSQTVCAGTALGSPGEDVFSLTTYAGPNATGAVLSAGTVQAKIASGGGDVPINNLTLTLDGVIASLRLSLSPKAGERGKPVTAAVSLTAFDATGAQIVGASPFLTPIALTVQGDTVHAFRLHAGRESGASLSIAKPTSDITLRYDGNRQASPVTIAASVSGSIGASAHFALHGKVPPPPVGTFYALNFGAGDGKAASVTEYDGKAKGNAAPELTLSLNSKLYARTIAVDSSGNLYVGYLDNSLGYDPGTGAPDAGNEIAIYGPGASGKSPPNAVLKADSKTNTALFPVFITFDPSGRLVTYGGTSVDGNTGDAVLTYPAGSSGPAAPEYAFDFTTSLDYAAALPSGLAIDSANNFYVNGGLHTPLGNQYGLYVAAAADIGNPQTAPARTIPWDSTTQLEPGFTTNVSLDRAGEIFIGTWVKEGSGGSATCQARVNVYAAGAGGGITDVPPLRILTLGDASTRGNDCYASRNPLLAYFPTIQIYGSSLFITDDFNNAIDGYSASAHGRVKPMLRIVGSATQLNAPTAPVVTSFSGPAKAGAVETTDSLDHR